jgi:hypothetical protein
MEEVEEGQGQWLQCRVFQSSWDTVQGYWTNSFCHQHGKTQSSSPKCSREVCLHSVVLGSQQPSAWSVSALHGKSDPYQCPHEGEPL